MIIHTAKYGNDPINIDTDDPAAVAHHIWLNTPVEAERGTYIYGAECDTVTVNGIEFAVGYDPNEDGILWALNYLDGDGTREPYLFGGWAPGDRQTAVDEINVVLGELNGGTR